jgi:hypothetical protein
MSETHQPPSQMLRVPTPLIDAVKELSRLYREGYTHAVITGLQRLIANFDSNKDINDINTDSKSDTELIIELIARVSQVEKTVPPIQQRLELLESELGESVA